MDVEKNGKNPAVARDPFEDPIEPVRSVPAEEPMMKGGKNGVPSGVPPEYSRDDLTAADTTHTEHVEYVNSNLVDPRTRNTKRLRLKRHCMRYWICYIIALIIALAIALPILFLVIFPAIAQHLVNQQDLLVENALLLGPTPDSIVIGLSSFINVPKPFTVVLDPLNMSLFMRETEPMTPFLELPLPKNKLRGNASIKINETRVDILDQDQWLQFLNVSVYSKEFVMSAKGETTGHFGKLKAPIKLDKDIKMRGLDRLNGFSVTGSQLLLAPDIDGNNIIAELNVPNHSDVTFDLGNQTLGFYIGNFTAGQGLIKNMNLVPGNNTLEMRGILDLEAVLQNIEYVLNVEAEALGAGKLRLWSRGVSTVYEGEHIPYYESILGGLTLVADIDVAGLLVGTLGGYLNGTAGGLQDILNALGPAAMNASSATAQLLAVFNVAFSRGTGAVTNIQDAVGNVFNSTTSGDFFQIAGAIGNAVGAVVNGATTGADIVGDIGTALGNGATTVGDILESLNFTALIPQPPPPA